MKKFLSIILVVVLFTACMGLTVSAEPKSYNVPKAAAIPVIDGTINADEWKGALEVEMKTGDESLFVASGELSMFEGAVFKFMWADDGIYFAVSVTDTTVPTNVPAFGGGSYNSGDGVQFNIYPNRETTGATNEEMFFFSYHPKTDNGQPAVGEHFIYGNGSTGQDVPEAKIASVMKGASYTIEGLIPSAALVKSLVPINIASGCKLYMNDVVMVDDGSAQGLIVDNEWFDGALANEYVLTDTLAGAVPAAEEVTEAPAEAAVEVQNTTSAPVVESTPAVSPTTSDNFIVSVLLILVAATVLTVSKKIKRKNII